MGLEPEVGVAAWMGGEQGETVFVDSAEMLGK